MRRRIDLSRGKLSLKSRARRRRRRLFERLESRRLLAADPMPLEYTIPDAGVANEIRLTVNEQVVEVRNIDGDLLASAAVLEVSEIIINGSADADTLTVDFSGGAFGVPVTFAGGLPDSGSGDALRLENADAETITHQIEDASSGSISIIGTGLDELVSYTGLEPIFDNLGAVDRVFTFLGGTETIVLEDDGNDGNGINRIDSTLGERIDFESPTGSITINAGTGSDLIQLERLDSATLISSLVVNGDADSDAINLNHLASGIAAEINGGADDDTVNIGMEEDGLTNVLGPVSVNPGLPLSSDNASGAAGVIAATDVTESVTAKSLSVSVTLPTGDQLNINDQASVIPHTYTLDETSITRAGSPSISYAMIDTLNVDTGSASDTFNVLTTRSSTTVNVNTFAGEDTISVTDSGDDSILRLNSGIDDDTVSIDSTGDRSVLLLTTASGDDDVQVATTGDSSGLDIRTGTEVDVVTLGGTGMASATAIRLGAGDDVANVRATAVGSFTDIFGGSENDTFNISSDADGDRSDASGSPAGNLDGILGEVCTHGNDNSIMSSLSESVTARGETVSVSTVEGDELNVADPASMAANSYTLGLDQFVRAGVAPITYAAIETLNLETGSGDDVVVVSSTRAGTRTTLNTRGGTADVTLNDTGDASVFLLDTRLDDDLVSVANTGDASLLRINTAAGDDDVTVTTTGASAGLDLRSGTNLDVVSLIGTGDLAVTAARLGPGDDIVNVRSLGMTSSTDLFLASGNDVTNLTSSADGSRLDPNGSLSGNLDGFLGELLVQANGNLAIPDVTESVTAKTETITVTTLVGDVLNLSDQGTSANNVYSLDAVEFTRNGISPIRYLSVETINIETGSGNDTFDLVTTPGNSTVTLDTFAGEDTITLGTSGDESIVRIQSGTNNDSIGIQTTGDRSVAQVVTAAGDDDVTVTSTGNDSGVDIRTGTEVDVVSLMANGDASATAIRLGAGDDIANLRSTVLGSFTDIFGGDGNDTTNVSSDADGDRSNPSGDPGGNLDGILGELCVHGNDNLSLPETTASVTSGAVTVSATVSNGDELNVSDEGSVSSAAYTLDLDQLTKVGNAPISYAAIESLNLETGSAADTVDVASTRANTAVSITTFGGNDAVSINDSGDGGILVVDSGSGNDVLSVTRTGDASVATLQTGDGEDDVEIIATGNGIGLEVRSGADSDVTTILSTGLSSATTIDLDAGEDIANIRSTGLASHTSVVAGTDNDTLNVASDANGNRANPTGSSGGDLNGIRGAIEFDGGDQSASPDFTASAATQGLTVSVTLAVGDQLNVTDQANTINTNYTLDASQLTRSGIAAIDFSNLETIAIETGSGEDSFDVSLTPDNATVRVDTASGEDSVTVFDSGAESILEIDTGTENDQVSITTTGARSVTSVVTAGGDDDVDVATTGQDSGLDVRTGTELDVVTLSGVGAGSASAVRLGAGDDINNLRSTASASFTDIFGGSGNDTTNVSSDADGNRANPSGDPAGDLDGVLGSIFVHGNGQLAAPVVTQSVATTGLSITTTVVQGDELNLSDEGNAAGGDYTLDLNQLTKTGIAPIAYAAIETLNLETGGSNDVLEIASTRAATRVSVFTGSGADQISLNDSGDDGIVEINSSDGSDTLSVTRTGDRSLLLVETWTGDDDVEVSVTGAASGLSVQTDSGSDVVSVFATGADSANVVDLGDDDDIGNVRSTALGSFTEITAGIGNDTLNLSSDANGNRLAPNGALAGDLNGMLGQLDLVGDLNLLNPENMASATAKALTITAVVPVGDQLNVSDQGNVNPETYTLDATTLTRLGLAPINYSTIETLNVETGSDADTFNVLTTPAETTINIETFAGADTVTITDSGEDGILRVDTGIDDDSVTIDTTGDRSVSQILTAAGDDDVTAVTTGTESGIDVRTGTEVDVVSLLGNGNDSATAIRLGAGDDIANVRSTSLGSFADLFGGSGNDTINVSSDADGDRVNPSGDPAGDLDGLLGELCVHGNANEATPEVTESVDAKTLTVSVTVARGDELNVSDEGNGAAGTYSLDLDQFSKTGIAPITYAAIETFHIETGSNADDFEVISTRANTLVRIDTFAGADSITIDDTGDNGILVVDSGSDNDLIEVNQTGGQSVLIVTTAEGEDDVQLVTTGTGSGTEIDTGESIDLVTVQNTGDDSATLISLGAGDDIANIQGTGTGSFTDVFGGAGDDTINVSSDANGTRPDPDGDLAGTLDGLLGDLCVFGEADSAGAMMSSTVEGRQTDADLVSLTTSIELGDELNVSDESSVADNDYTIDATTFVRTGVAATGTLTYATVEAVSVETGPGSDTIDILSTSDSTAFELQTLDGDDTVSIVTTGQDSIVELETADGADSITISGTGDDSVVNVSTGIESDTLSIESIGDNTGIAATTGDDADSILLAVEPVPSARTNTAVIQIDAGAGEDQFTVDEVYLETVVDLAGGADNDQFLLTADGGDTGGYLGRLNDDPASDPSDDVVARTRQLFLDGGGNGAATSTVIQGVTLSPDPVPEPVEGSVAAVVVGDTVLVDAATVTDPLDLRYAITGPAEGVLATTIPGDPRSEVGNEVFETLGIENVDLIAGGGDDLLTVSSDVPIEITQTLQTLSFDGGPGTNRFEIVGTDDDDQITVGELGGDLEPFELDNVAFLRVDGNAGDDQIVNNTFITGVMNGLTGSDLIVGGFGQDLITGGAGVDFIFGRSGNDVLLVDQDLGNDAPFVVAGEIIDGDSESVIPSGDVCIQLDVDQVRDCELLGDGGGIKDVLTWLRAIIVDPGEIRFDPLSPVFDPFLPAFPQPTPVLSVTEPSKLPFSASLDTGLFSRGTTDSSEVNPYDRNPYDTNQDGRVSPADVLYVINRLASAPDAVGFVQHERWWIRETADVDGDGYIRAFDALMIVNYLSVPDSKGDALGETTVFSESESSLF